MILVSELLTHVSPPRALEYGSFRMAIRFFTFQALFHKDKSVYDCGVIKRHQRCMQHHGYLSIVVHCHPLLSIVVHCCPMSSVIHCCPLSSIVAHCCALSIFGHCCPLLLSTVDIIDCLQMVLSLELFDYCSVCSD